MQIMKCINHLDTRNDDIDAVLDHPCLKYIDFLYETDYDLTIVTHIGSSPSHFAVVLVLLLTAAYQSFHVQIDGEGKR